MFFKRRNKYRISFIDDGILGYLCCLYKKVLFQQFQSLSFRYIFTNVGINVELVSSMMEF